MKKGPKKDASLAECGFSTPQGSWIFIYAFTVISYLSRVLQYMCIFEYVLGFLSGTTWHYLALPGTTSARAETPTEYQSGSTVYKYEGRSRHIHNEFLIRCRPLGPRTAGSFFGHDGRGFLFGGSRFKNMHLRKKRTAVSEKHSHSHSHSPHSHSHREK